MKLLPLQVRTLAVLVWIASGSLLLVEHAAGQEKKEKFATKAVTLEGKQFLKVPNGLKEFDFVVAKTPPKVDVCFFDGLKTDKKGTLWSSWGDGCLASNGKYYTSVGDHLGIDANAYVYEYDPKTKMLRRVVDVLRAIMQMLGLYGHGKIHSGIHEGADGKLYFATYWGKHRQIEEAFKKGYRGSIVMCYDPETGETENLGAIVPKQGLPASTFDPRRQLLYFHAVYKGDIAVFDIKQRKRIFLGGAGRTNLSRCFLLGDNGRVYFSVTDNTLDYYDPKTNSLGKTEAKLPDSKNPRKGRALRAASRASKKGVLYGMTSSGQLFSFDPSTETIKDLGPNFGNGSYTAVVALSPDDKYLYFAPGAHGGGNRIGCPIVQYEIATGKRKVLAFLAKPMADKLSYKVGGTYNLQIDPKGDRLYITFNGGEPDSRVAFGKPCVTVIHIPKSER